MNERPFDSVAPLDGWKNRSIDMNLDYLALAEIYYNSYKECWEKSSTLPLDVWEDLPQNVKDCLVYAAKNMTDGMWDVALVEVVHEPQSLGQMIQKMIIES
jgi:TRAP-type mannitol/chloroaromatic compound transport system substrate-binding protein